MEKMMYPLWKPDDITGDEFRDQLLHQLAREIADLKGVHGARLCVADSAVEDAAARRIVNHAPAPDALLSLWVDYAGAAKRWEPLIDAFASHRAAYLVVESEPLVNLEKHPCAPGQRVYGMCHIAFLSPPADMPRDEWLAIWKDSHTQIAIDTQSTFGYRQNLVVRRLGDDTRPCHIIVEENFPPEAMLSDHAFYDSGGDDERLQDNMSTLLDSCARFIDFQTLDVVAMSEYLIRPLVRP